jgi:hypothetical protein
VVEQALEEVLPFEREKSSPRVSGALIFDSMGHEVETADLARMVLWCPPTTSGNILDQISQDTPRNCPVQPDIPDIQLGPFRFSTLPILPTRAQYLDFINRYSDAQGGYMKSLTFLAPERTPLSDNFPAGDFGTATFFNNEVVTASPGDVFSYCQPQDKRASAIVFRTGPGLPPQPLANLPDLHDSAPQSSYALGVFWEFPYLLRLQYEVIVAGAATAYALTVPFGIAAPNTNYWGTQLWAQGEFDLSQTLLKCTQFCGHPTFDSAGVYNVGQSFHDAYRTQCYRPKYPAPGDGGFPLDP